MSYVENKTETIPDFNLHEDWNLEILMTKWFFI